jgi:hypothetical protein
LFFQALAYDPADTPVEVQQHVHGALGFLTMVTPECPKMLEEPLRRMLEHHRSWLRPSPRPAPVFVPPYSWRALQQPPGNGGEGQLGGEAEAR